MAMIDEERLFAWLDGELDEEEAARIQAELDTDPKLAELAAKHRAMKARLKAAFDPVLEAPMPEQVVAGSVPKRDSVVDFEAASRARAPRRWGSLPQWAAMAATLAIGILVGTMVPGRTAGPVAVEGGRIYAAAALDQ